ncbi:YlxR family protein [Amycolatopsis sp. NBC_01307]|uniref:YlxR family protein n=1 Tax=unclassified Amycolatopsis TaxID=2618356 RepID=UPI002E12A552
MKVEAVDSGVVRSPRRVAERQPHRESPVRTCVGCKRRALIGELLRVVAVAGRVVVDGRRRLPGRGAWLHPDADCLAKAERRRAFPRALRAPGALDVREVRGYVEHATHHEAGTSPAPRGTKEAGRPVMSQP